MDRNTYQFIQADVFTDRVFAGNPLAVFLDGEGLSDAQMQAVAREMNLSETSFVLPARSGGTARVRIFTPGVEMPFAGHPTIGTAYVLARKGRAPGGKLVLEENAGDVAVTLVGDAADPTMLWFEHPDAVLAQKLPGRPAFAAALGLEERDLLAHAPVQIGGRAVRHLYLGLRDRAAVDRAMLDVPALRRAFGGADAPAVFVFAPDGARAGRTLVYSRMFAPHAGDVPEDPATGSASGPLGLYVVEHGLAPAGAAVEIISEQGTKMGRQSFIHIRVSAGPQQPTVAIGGSAVEVLRGELTLPAPERRPALPRICRRRRSCSTPPLPTPSALMRGSSSKPRSRPAPSKCAAV